MLDKKESFSKRVKAIGVRPSIHFNRSLCSMLKTGTVSVGKE